MKTRTQFLLLSLPFLLAATGLAADVKPSEDSPIELMARASAGLHSDKGDSIRATYKSALRFFHEPSPKIWSELPRKEKMIFSLHLLNGLTSTLQRYENRDDGLVYLNVGAPGVPVSGMDPKQITDPDIRREYEQRIADNAQKGERLRTKSLLRLLKRTWTENVQYLVRQQYGRSGDDVAELRALLDEVVSDSSLRSELGGLWGTGL